MMVNLSILNSPRDNLKEYYSKFQMLPILHMDIMDGKFVPNTSFDEKVVISKNYIEIKAENTTIRYGDKNGKATLSTNLVPAEDERIVWVWTQYDFSENTENPIRIDRHEEGEELTILAVDPKDPHNNLQSSIFVTAYLVDEKDNVLFASEPQKITVTADISVPSDSITVKDEKGNVINDISVTVGKTITISLGDEFDELVKKYDKLAIEWYVNGKAAGNGTSCEIPVSDNSKPLKIKIKFSYNGKEITSVERTITIKNPTSGVIINAPAGEVYKNSVVTVTATATGIKANSGCVLAIFDGGKEVARGDNKSVSYRIPEEITANRTLAVKVVDKDGKVQKDSNGKELSGKIEIKVKTGFFDMLIAFFKKLFGANKVTIKP